MESLERGSEKIQASTRDVRHLSCCILSSLLASLSASPPVDLRINLIHIDSRSNFSTSELFHRASQRTRYRTKTRELKLTNSSPNFRSSLHSMDGEYLLELAIGTPSIPFMAIVDTGSDLIWTQCEPCISCFAQPTPYTTPPGPLPSLHSPAQALCVRASHTITAPRVPSNITSPLLFGSLADLNASSGATQSTPLAQNPFDPSFYYLDLKGISIGETLLPIRAETFELKKDGSGGVIIDTGTALTRLEQAGYDIVAREIKSIVNLPLVNSSELCFSLSSRLVPNMPDMILHFEGANMTLPMDNYMIVDSNKGLFCLAMIGVTGGSILGNYQQKNIHILYNLAGGMLSFVPAKCSEI
uniref:Peptidase A1 domain-containing protein n=1 Tax=Ananas comosus var. bracteatus TaxID=296719 RepID=A0A6V7PF65_ANACO|nr:unnamed protein product [Ananas comosus var. bracteatus]